MLGQGSGAGGPMVPSTWGSPGGWRNPQTCRAVLVSGSWEVGTGRLLPPSPDQEDSWDFVIRLAASLGTEQK